MSKLQTCGRFQCFCYHFTQFISGNMFRDSDEDNRTDQEKDYSNYFLRRASRIAPVFLSTGNHEWYYTHEDYEVIRQTGTTLLDNAHTHVEIKGQKLLVGGLSTRVDLEWLEEFLSTTADHKILLCHHPEYVKRYVEDRGQVDLIVSGHAHGGQWRMFGKLPVYAPGQGLFPRYSKGVYETEAGPVVVTTGCANHISYPRFGNPCEIVLLNL
ncbi:MAG: metallophosphoesterase [Lachnospiraceae bacterium]